MYIGCLLRFIHFIYKIHLYFDNSGISTKYFEWGQRFRGNLVSRFPIIIPPWPLGWTGLPIAGNWTLRKIRATRLSWWSKIKQLEVRNSRLTGLISELEQVQSYQVEQDTREAGQVWAVCGVKQGWEVVIRAQGGHDNQLKLQLLR